MNTEEMMNQIKSDLADGIPNKNAVIAAELRVACALAASILKTALGVSSITEHYESMAFELAKVADPEILAVASDAVEKSLYILNC